jgi:hypothetical protein
MEDYVSVMRILFNPTWSYPDPALVTISMVVLIIILVTAIAYRIYMNKKNLKMTLE